MKRKDFLKSIAAGSALALAPGTAASALERSSGGDAVRLPGAMAVSTWDFKLPVNETAMSTLAEGGSLLDAVEKAVNIVEADPKTTSVGRGGFPDRDGHLTLDACIMDELGNAGSVVFLEHIMHPISVARRVMEKTPHVILAGEGALQFAVEQGFPREDLLSPNAKAAYEQWLKESHYNPKIDEHNHDTLGLIVMDAKGAIAGGCSTSGAAWKLRGRVGDSPIIGAGLFVDSEVGGATSTGYGELVIKTSGSFLAVELMRRGATPQEACEETVDRIVKRQPKAKEYDGFVVGFVAMNRSGDVGAFSYRNGLQYSLMRNGSNAVHDATFYTK